MTMTTTWKSLAVEVRLWRAVDVTGGGSREGQVGSRVRALERSVMSKAPGVLAWP
jgi:hypothetical protein